MKAPKIFFVLLVVFMATPFFAFATGGPGEEATPVLFMAATNDPAVMAANKLVQLAVEKKFNVKLTFSEAPWYNEPDKFRAIIAAGALPDCGWTCLTVKAPELYQMGVIRSIPIATAEKYAPTYMKKMKDRPMMKAWQQINDKEYYAFYQVGTIGGGGSMSTALRLDWMENLGITPKGNVQLLVPAGTVTKDGEADKDTSANARFYVTDYQYTYDEFVSIIEAFVKKDPDKNGKADTVGLSDAILEWMDGYWSFHIFPDGGFRWVREADGSAAWHWYSKVFKAFLEEHKALADRGLLNPDYVTCQYDECWAYWTSGKAGAIGICTNYTGPASIPPFSILYENPNAKVLLIPPTKGRTGLDAGFMGGSDIGEFFFNKKLSDAKFQKLLQMFDWMYADDEGSTFCNWGVKDVNYKVEADGTKTFLKDANAKLPPEQRIEQGVYCTPGQMNFSAPAKFDLKTRVGLVDTYEAAKWPKPAGYYVFYGPGSAATLNAMPFMSAENQKLAEAAYRQYVTDLCGGKTDANTAYEKMMSVLNNMGYQDFLKAVQTSMYIVTELQQGKAVTPSQVIKK
jgi:hypothetical protein